MPSPVKQKTAGKHVGYGKVILFGEHFVVHGSEAVVAGISEYTECSLEVLKGKPGVEVIDNRPAVPGYIKEKRAEQKKAHQLVLDHLKIDTKTDGLRMTIGGPLVPSSGIGASASDVVALSRALSELYDLKLSEEQVNNSAFIGEAGYHGTPSGVDNTAATFGGLISYVRKDDKSLFRTIKFPKTLYLVVIGTGITASTTTVVADVRKLKEENPKQFLQLTTKYNTVVEAAIGALQDGDLNTVGKLMNECHQLCVQLTISCKELEAIVNCCRRNGALGAKLSGTGRGGIAVALVTSEGERDSLVEKLKAECPEAKFIWKYTVSSSKKAHL